MNVARRLASLAAANHNGRVVSDEGDVASGRIAVHSAWRPTLKEFISPTPDSRLLNPDSFLCLPVSLHILAVSILR
jgi:hypothetical protein